MNNIAFIGCGGIATAHAYALDNLKYYYPSSNLIFKKYIASHNIDKCKLFQKKFTFQKSLSINELFIKNDYDTVFILSPNSSHCEYLLKILECKHIENIYLEKPICCTQEELDLIKRKTAQSTKNIQIGFQFLYMSAIRHAYTLWKTLAFGELINFNVRYLHSGYLDKEYRDKRHNRLLDAPFGGALVDLGSHAFSILVKFLGNKLSILNATYSGRFTDVPESSDLCSLITILDDYSKAVGTLTASRINFGTGDQLEFELFATNGAIRFSTLSPDLLSYCHNDTDKHWVTIECGNNFLPDSNFPNIHAPAGWLRSLIHAHHVFLSGNNNEQSINIEHGLFVQQLILNCIKKWEKIDD